MAAGRKGFPWSTSFCSRSARRCWPTGSGYGQGAAKPSRASPAAGTDAMLVYSHCHVDAGEFDRDRDEVIARARAAGVARQVVPAIHAAGWPKLRDICAGTNGLFPAYGLHPMFLAEHRPEHLSQLLDWIEREHPVAVGECGLDHFVEGLDHDAQ